ncbi:protein-tyrosine phosphatase family protein [uncultured Shimia sp.]|uniref:phosphatase domain-containing protein n=1 Tax=uncultured Shimia sp. TaxID=573152 RepID=UPI00261C45BA|nr:protein-tyrosine phosphatase family protein [uncultured Shimia sp.]
MGFAIATLELGEGALGISPIPGGDGDVAEAVETISAWRASLVLTLTEAHELDAAGAQGLGTLLAEHQIAWWHRPIVDFQNPSEQEGVRWAALCEDVAGQVAAGARVLIHCKGGCGRSGMVLLRVLLDGGETPSDALARLREVRPCAVETDAQMAWATHGVLTQA